MLSAQSTNSICKTNLGCCCSVRVFFSSLIFIFISLFFPLSGGCLNFFFLRCFAWIDETIDRNDLYMFGWLTLYASPNSNLNANRYEGFVRRIFQFENRRLNEIIMVLDYEPNIWLAQSMKTKKNFFGSCFCPQSLLWNYTFFVSVCMCTVYTSLNKYSMIPSIKWFPRKSRDGKTKKKHLSIFSGHCAESFCYNMYDLRLLERLTKLRFTNWCAQVFLPMNMLWICICICIYASLNVSESTCWAQLSDLVSADVETPQVTYIYKVPRIYFAWFWQVIRKKMVFRRDETW